MIEGAHEPYWRDGYAVREAAIPSTLAADLARQLERGVDAMAAELDVSRATYLAAVCRWSTLNPLVEALVESIAERLRPLASEQLGARVRPGRASVFRKGAEASAGTHGHQDAGYWVRPTSSRYHATTWVALDAVDEDSGALRVLPGSHRGAVAPPADYLAANFVDPAASWGAEARTVVLPAGGAVTFDPKLWHASHSAKSGHVRRALAIRWVLDEDVSQAEVVAHAEPSQAEFGMYTSGVYLHAALRRLAGGDVPAGAAGVRWAVDHRLAERLPNPDVAEAALERLLVFLKASAAHHASDQRGMVWEAVRDAVIAPVIGLGSRS